MVNKWIAAIISFFFAGIGQIIQGQIKKGIIMFGILVVLELIYHWLLNIQTIFPEGYGSLFGLVVFAYSVYAAYDAYHISENVD